MTRVLAALVVASTLLLAAPSYADESRVVAFGDSITLGVGTHDPDSQSWPALIGAHRAARAGGCLVVDDCWSRRPSIDSYDRRVLAKHPDVVTVAFGINDLLAGGSNRDILGGLRAIVQENRGLGIRTYVATITPVRVDIDFDPTRVRFNRQLRHAFAPWQILDFDRALVGPDGNLPRRYDSGDGIHPNALGYRRLAQVAARTIGKAA